MSFLSQSCGTYNIEFSVFLSTPAQKSFLKTRSLKSQRVLPLFLLPQLFLSLLVPPGSFQAYEVWEAPLPRGSWALLRPCAEGLPRASGEALQQSPCACGGVVSSASPSLTGREKKALQPLVGRYSAVGYASIHASIHCHRDLSSVSFYQRQMPRSPWLPAVER